MRNAASAPKGFGKPIALSCTGRGTADLPPLCRPAGWAALWRRIGNLSVLNREHRLSA